MVFRLARLLLFVMEGVDDKFSSRLRLRSLSTSLYHLLPTFEPILRHDHNCDEMSDLSLAGLVICMTSMHDVLTVF
jgi:hypothetical protein